MKWSWLVSLGVLLAIACDGDLPTTSDAGAVDGGLGGASGSAGDGPGAAAGMAGIGGMAGAGGACPTFTFVTPRDTTTLTEQDDLDHVCSPEFTTNIEIATDAPDGTAVLLTVGAVRFSVQAHDALVEFPEVQLFPGANALSVELPQGACLAAATVWVQCNIAPPCQITSPVISAAHPQLNGVLAPDGDRVSALNLPYRTAFDVSTGIADGELVTLQVDGLANSAAASAQAGVAHFPAVELAPDGNHQLIAQCHAGADVVNSAPFPVAVDSVAPDLTVISPIAGEHLGPESDLDPSTVGLTEFDVCMTTNSVDAIDLAVHPGLLHQENFCVAIGTQTPTCVQATTSAGANACVRFQCPGDDAFDITTTLTDLAGNATTTTVIDVSCASSKPAVQITSPPSGSIAAVTSHLLAASSSQTLRDQRPNVPGAQWTVRACTDTVSGSAVLYGGDDGGTLNQLAGPVALLPAQAIDNCPSGLFGVARFIDATLPESEESLSGTLDTQTELRVDVTSAASELGQSDPRTLWVDSFLPSLSIFSTVRCGDLVRSGAAAEAVTFQFASAYDVSAALLPATGPSQENTFTVLGAGLTIADTFDLTPGENLLIASNEEPSGNTAALQTCPIELGDPPIVTWTAPADDSKLNVATDGDSNVAGWQGDLSVTISNIDLVAESPSLTVQFFRNGTSLGAPVLANTVTGVAILTGVTIDDGEDVVLEAVTNDSSKGIGRAKLRQGNSTQLLVDTIAPDAPTNAVLALLNRRQTSFRFRWTAPADDGQQVGGYLVRVHTTAIDASNFDNPALSKVTFAGNTGAPGTANIGVTINNRLIERDYYAAVVATDAAGNRSPVVSAGPSAGHFNVSVLPKQHIGEGFGMALDGSSSLDGDARSDLVVGTEYGNRVYVWFAPATGNVAYSGAPGLTITGPTGVGFGNYAVSAGDLNDDGLEDLVVGAPFDNPWGSGLVYVFLQPAAGWPSALNAASADATVAANPDDSDFDFAFTGGSLGRLGDFDGDGLDDVAIGLPYWGPDGFTGYVAVLRGASDLSGAVILPDDVGTSGSHRVTAILGESGLMGGFSTPVIGLGPFYADSGNSIVVGGWQGDPSRIYTFAGEIGDSDAQLYASSADHTVQNNQGAFGQILTLLGVVGGKTGVGVAQPTLDGIGGIEGRVTLFFGDSTTGPFASSVLIDNTNSIDGDNFGTVIVGSAIPGGSLQGSFLGASAPDVAVAGSHEQGHAPVLYFLEGQTVQALLGQTVDIATVADAALDLSLVTGLSNWQGTSPGGTPILDLNGDGFMDLAIGEHEPSFGPIFDGRVVVVW